MAKLTRHQKQHVGTVKAGHLTIKANYSILESEAKPQMIYRPGESNPGKEPVSPELKREISTGERGA